MVHSTLAVFRFSEYNFIVICSIILNFVSTTIKLQENICQSEYVIVGFLKYAYRVIGGFLKMFHAQNPPTKRVLF
jgi:hypothetical protein